MAGPAAANRIAAAILRSASECFEKFGVEKTTMEDVARGAKLSRITVYRHFQNRELLLQAVLADRSRRFIKRAEVASKNWPTLADAIVEFTLLAIRSTASDRTMQAMFQSQSNDVVAANAAGSELFEQILEELWLPLFDKARESGELRASIDPHSACRWLAMLLFMFAEQSAQRRMRSEELRTLLEAFVVPSLIADIPGTG